MVTKKISSEIAVGIIMTLAVLIGVLFWIQSRDGENRNTEIKIANSENKKIQTGIGMTDPVVTPIVGPPTLVYKTRGDYFNLVPVGLSEDKMAIESYPDMTDVKPNRYPTRLAGGYLLGDASISSGFLKLTFEEYANLVQLPDSPEKFYALLLDKEPFTEMYDCGSRYEFSDVEKELSQLIENGKLASRCDRIK